MMEINDNKAGIGRLRRPVYHADQSHSLGWQIIMVCPCGCKKLLYMNAIKDHHPYWQIEIHGRDSVLLHPSVHRQVGCN